LNVAQSYNSLAYGWSILHFSFSTAFRDPFFFHSPVYRVCQYTEYTGCNSIQYSPIYWVYQYTVFRVVRIFSIHQYTGCTKVQNPTVITGCTNIQYPPVYRVYQYAVFTSIPGVSIQIIHQYTGCANIRNIQGVTVYSIHLQYTGCTNVQNPKVITGCINIPYPPVYRVYQYTVFTCSILGVPMYRIQQ